MNKYLLFSLFLLQAFSLKAWDEIITDKNDTIYCKIVSIKDDYIRYEVTNSDGSRSGKMINMNQIIEYKYIPDEAKTIRRNRNTIHFNKPDNLWEVGLSTGYSNTPWLFDNMQTSYPDEFYSKLKTGLHLSLSAHYMVFNFLGVGVDYSFLNMSHQDSFQSAYQSMFYITTSSQSRQYINYAGPSLLFKQNLDKKHKITLNESISGGFLFYRLEEQNSNPYYESGIYYNINTNSLLTGTSLAGKIGISAEYKLLPYMSLGLGGNFIYSTLKKVNIKSKGTDDYEEELLNYELNEAINLSRIDYSFVLRFHF